MHLTMLILATATFLTAATAEVADPSPIPAPSGPQVSFAVDAPSNSLMTATVDNRTYKIVDKAEERCLILTDTRDFDGDGLTDALVGEGKACGGNGAGFSFFFIGYASEGWFRHSDPFGDYNIWGNPVVERWNDTWTVVVDLEDHFDEPVLGRYIRLRYGFRGGMAVLLERAERMEQIALKEIRATAFQDHSAIEVRELHVDLNDDALDDVISCTLWDRWGLLEGTVKDAQGNALTVKGELRGKRIGVLECTTLGYHDLVVNHNDIYRWNGERYAPVEQR